jgi:hypothetical protein
MVGKKSLGVRSGGMCPREFRRRWSMMMELEIRGFPTLETFSFLSPNQTK